MKLFIAPLINYVFSENENTERILNTVINKCEKNNIVIIRDINSYKDIEILIKNYTKNNQIVFRKRKTNKIGSFLYSVYSIIISKFFGHNLLQADYAIALYGEIASKVLKHVVFPAVLLRSNNWTGIDCVLIEETQKNYNFGYNKYKCVFSVITPFIIFTIMLILSLVLKFNFVPLGSVLYYMSMGLCLFISFMFGAKWILNAQMGEAISDKAKYK